MYLGGTGCTTAAVASGTSAEQNNDIPGIGGLTDDIAPRRRTHDRTDLHTFCHIIGMINLLDKAGRQSDLVSVGGIAVCRAADKLLLGQLTL